MPREKGKTPLACRLFGHRWRRVVIGKVIQWTLLRCERCGREEPES